jgi:hypothetical protein
MSKPSKAVHLVYNSAAGPAPMENQAAALPNAVDEHYDHLLDMLSAELAIVHPPHCQRDPVWNARIAELEAQLDVDGLARAFALALDLNQKPTEKS